MAVKTGEKIPPQIWQFHSETHGVLKMLGVSCGLPDFRRGF